MPRTIDGARLTDAQLEWLDNVAQGLMDDGHSESSAWAIAVSQFKDKYRKEGDHWVTDD